MIILLRLTTRHCDSSEFLFSEPEASSGADNLRFFGDNRILERRVVFESLAEFKEIEIRGDYSCNKRLCLNDPVKHGRKPH